MDYIFLTEKEYKILQERFPRDLKARLESLNNHIGKIGIASATKKYKSHYHTILSWANREEKPTRKLNLDVLPHLVPDGIKDGGVKK